MMRWFDAVAAEWAQERGRKGFAQVGVQAAAGKEKPALSEPIAVRGTAKRDGKAVPLLITAGEQAVVTAAKMAAGSEMAQALDDAAIAAFGERAKKIFAGVEAAIKADGLEGLGIEAEAAARMESLPEEFLSGGMIVPVVVSFEDNSSVPFSLVYGAGFRDLFPWFAAPAPFVPTVNIARILRIEVPLVVEIARKRFKVGDALAMRPGTVLEFAKNSEDFLELRVGKARIGRGEAVKVGESFGMRVLEIGSVRERIETLRQ